MAEKMKRVRLPVTVGVVDPEASTPERRHESGFLIEPAVTATKLMPPGTPVEMPEAQANRLLALHGPYVETVIVSEGEVPMAPVVPAVPVANARR